MSTNEGVVKAEVPDLEQVSADTKTQELIEEFETESRTRPLVGRWAARPTVGGPLPALVFAAIAYAYLADFMPGPFRGPPKNLDDIVGNQYLGLDGMLGTPLQVAATFIILFTIYGAILDYTGAGKFYVDLAFALTGKRPTGAARTVTVASFLLGTVSGSGVATTVTLGSITYPMLKRAGHDRESSGAILSAGGRGRAVSPPA